MNDEVVVLVDDSAFGSRGLIAEHGFSVLISLGGMRIVFDTGQTGYPLLLNSSMLGLNLSCLDAVALSHGHYDHTGGLYILSRMLRCRPKLFAHPHALKPSIKMDENGRQEIGIPYSRGFLEESFQLTLEKDVLEIAPKVYFLGEIPRYHPDLTSHIARTYTVEGGSLVPHTFADDSALAVDLGEDLLIITGCSHSGVVNIALHAERTLGKSPGAILGGLHLAGKPLDFVSRVADRLKELGVTKIYPGHCTGIEATALLLQRFRGEALRAGMTLQLR